MADSISFYCASMSEEGVFYRITVWADRVTCGCKPGETWCSHIEATMVAGERAMVHADDRKKADKAMALFVGTLMPHPGWQAAWRKKMKWRGLGTGLTRAPSSVGQKGLPVVCFTGSMDEPRRSLLEAAKLAGWEAIDSPHRLIDVLVAADPTGGSTKLKAARKWGIPVISLSEWRSLTAEGELQAKA